MDQEIVSAFDLLREQARDIRASGGVPSSENLAARLTDAENLIRLAARFVHALGQVELCELRRRVGVLNTLTSEGGWYEQARLTAYDVLVRDAAFAASAPPAGRDNWSKLTAGLVRTPLFLHEIDATLARAEVLQGTRDGTDREVLGSWHRAVWRLNVELDLDRFWGSNLLLEAAQVYPGAESNGPVLFRALRDDLLIDLPLAAGEIVAAARELVSGESGAPRTTPSGSEAEPPIPLRRQTCHCRVVYWDNPEPYFFTTNQSKVVRLLWEKWESRTHYATLTEMLEAAEARADISDSEGDVIPTRWRASGTNQLRQVFRNHPNWTELIVRADRSVGAGATGLYRLRE